MNKERILFDKEYNRGYTDAMQRQGKKRFQTKGYNEGYDEGIITRIMTR